MKNTMTFTEALEKSQRYKKRHLMLGNGFSISCRPDIFIYGKLFEQADFSHLSPSAKKAFEALKTNDFERVIKRGVGSGGEWGQVFHRDKFVTMKDLIII